MDLTTALANQIELFRLQHGLPQIHSWGHTKRDAICLSFEEDNIHFYILPGQEAWAFTRVVGASPFGSVEATVHWLVQQGLDVRSEPERFGCPKPQDIWADQDTVYWAWGEGRERITLTCSYGKWVIHWGYLESPLGAFSSDSQEEAMLKVKVSLKTIAPQMWSEIC